MKSKKTLLAIILISLILGHQYLYAQTAQELLPKAIQLEEVKGELNEAIKVYQSIVDLYPDNGNVCAEALLRMGNCYEKLGMQEAVRTYQRLVNNYPQQKNEVAIARDRLSHLIPIVENVSEVPVKPTFIRIQIPTGSSWDMHLSPYGQKVSIVTDNTLWIMPLSGQLKPDIPGAPVKVNIQGMGVYGHIWSGDGNWIAFNGVPLKELEQDYYGNMGIYIVPSNGGKPKKVVDNYRGERTVNYRISLSPEGKILAFSSVENNKQHIYVIPVEGGNPKQLTDMEAREPAFSPDGRMIAFVEDHYMGGEGGDLYVVSAQGGTPKHLAEAVNASNPVWSPNGDMIAFLDYGGTRININFIPIGVNGEVTSDPIVIEAPEGIDGVWLLAGWSNDNKIGGIFERSTETGLYTLPVMGGKAMQVALEGGQPRWSPDGERIYCINYPDETNSDWRGLAITSIPVEGGSFKTVLIESDTKIGIPAFGTGNRISTDGKTIVFSGKTKTDLPFYINNNIWILPVEGGKPKQLTDTAEQTTDMFPCWSPDGKTIAFVRASIPKNASESYDIHANINLVQVNTGEQTVLTGESDSVYFGPIEWSPDGKFIAFLSQMDSTSNSVNLKLISANGDNKSRVLGVVNNAHPGIQFAWSPDSKQIAFSGSKGRVIRIISLDDGNTESIETGLVDSNIGDRLDWSPDGQKFVFVGGKGETNEFWLLKDFLPLFEAQ